jgi:hypothetical protein
MEGKMTDWPRAKANEIQCKEKLTTGRRCTGTCVDPTTRKTKGPDGKPVRGGYCAACYRREDMRKARELAYAAELTLAAETKLALALLRANRECNCSHCLYILQIAEEG